MKYLCWKWRVASALLRADSFFHVAQSSYGEDVSLPRCTGCCGRIVLTVQSLRQESEVCQPVQLITQPLSHSGQRVFAGEPKHMMCFWHSMQQHSNSKIGVDTFSSSHELCHVIYPLPHDVFSFSSRGNHSDSCRASFPSQCSATWQTVLQVFIPLDSCFNALLSKCHFHIVQYCTQCFLN